MELLDAVSAQAPLGVAGVWWRLRFAMASALLMPYKPLLVCQSAWNAELERRVTRLEKCLAAAEIAGSGTTPPIKK